MDAVDFAALAQAQKQDLCTSTRLIVTSSDTNVPRGRMSEALVPVATLGMPRLTALDAALETLEPGAWSSFAATQLGADPEAERMSAAMGGADGREAYRNREARNSHNDFGNYNPRAMQNNSGFTLRGASAGHFPHFFPRVPGVAIRQVSDGALSSIRNPPSAFVGQAASIGNNQPVTERSSVLKNDFTASGSSSKKKNQKKKKKNKAASNAADSSTSSGPVKPTPAVSPSKSQARPSRQPSARQSSATKTSARPTPQPGKPLPDGETFLQHAAQINPSRRNALTPESISASEDHVSVSNIVKASVKGEEAVRENLAAEPSSEATSSLSASLAKMNVNGLPPKEDDLLSFYEDEDEHDDEDEDGEEEEEEEDDDDDDDDNNNEENTQLSLRVSEKCDGHLMDLNLSAVEKGIIMADGRIQPMATSRFAPPEIRQAVQSLQRPIQESSSGTIKNEPDFVNDAGGAAKFELEPSFAKAPTKTLANLTDASRKPIGFNAPKRYNASEMLVIATSKDLLRTKASNTIVRSMIKKPVVFYNEDVDESIPDEDGIYRTTWTSPYKKKFKYAWAAKGLPSYDDSKDDELEGFANSPPPTECGEITDEDDDEWPREEKPLQEARGEDCDDTFHSANSRPESTYHSASESPRSCGSGQH